MLCLIFPKRFEFSHFIISIIPYIHKRIYISYLGCDLIVFKRLSGYIAILAKLINDSDIGFQFKLNQFFVTLKKNYGDDEFKTIKFINIGSCGCFDDKKNLRQVNNYFRITRTIKYDRGELVDHICKDNNGQCNENAFNNDKYAINFKIRPKKILEINLDSFGEHHTIFSSNFLCNISQQNAKKLFSDINKYNCFLVDMESYDYFYICKQHQAYNLGYIRIISDMCGEKSKFNRVFNFKFSVDIVNYILDIMVEETGIGEIVEQDDDINRRI